MLVPRGAVENYRLGMCITVHAHRREDAIFQELLIRAARDLLEECTKQEITGVAVLESYTRSNSKSPLQYFWAKSSTPYVIRLAGPAKKPGVEMKFGTPEV